MTLSRRSACAQAMRFACVVLLMAACKQQPATTAPGAAEATTTQATPSSDAQTPASQSTRARSDGDQPHTTETASFTRPPVIDSHVHIVPLRDPVARALHIFERVGVVKFAVKSAGQVGTPKYDATKRVAELLGEKMAFFTNLDWRGIDKRGWGRREAKRIAQAMRDGASGIKIFKALGLGVRLKNGSLLKIGDKRLEPIWRAAGRLGAIVAWHVADPVAFFEPITPENERYQELSMAPEWSFHGKDYPSHDALLAARDRIVRRHPKTTFLGIHLANHPEDIDYVAKLLDRCPNLFVDVSARVPEIGRHPPEKVRAFFVKYQDRILFGTDLIVSPQMMQLGSVSKTPPTVEDAVTYYQTHYRFFETDDKQIAHPTPSQGDWKIDAIHLSEDVLKKFYYDNADTLIFAPRRRWLAAHSAKGG